MSWSPSAQEIADRYTDSRVRVMALAADLSDDQHDLPVPATPKWTVRELLSHFVGCPIELAAGNFEGAGGDEWTQAQVEARVGVSVDQLMAEWGRAAEKIDTAIRAGEVPAPVTFDVVTHEQDLRGALGAPRLPDPVALRFVVDGFGSRVEKAVEKAGLAPLELRDPDTGWSAGATGGVAVEATEFELFRSLTGRRSGRQVMALAWSGDPSPYLDLLCPFGPLRETDVVD